MIPERSNKEPHPEPPGASPPHRENWREPQLPRKLARVSAFRPWVTFEARAFRASTRSARRTRFVNHDIIIKSVKSIAQISFISTFVVANKAPFRP